MRGKEGYELWDLRKASTCATLDEYEKQMLRAYLFGVILASRSAVQAFDRGYKS